VSIRHVDSSQDGEQTALNTLFDGRTEYKFGKSPWSWFLHGLLELDDFRAWDSRVSLDSGLGYRWVDTERTNLTTRVGGSTSREIGGTVVDPEWKPELLGGIEFSHKFSDTQKISFGSDYYPNVEDFSDYRLNSHFDWEMIIAPDWGLSMKLSVIDRYDSTPGGKKPNDINYSLLMLLSF